MDVEAVEPGEEETVRRQEEARTSHWWFSKRGPKFLSPIFRLMDPALQRVKPYIKKGQVVVDLGCGWGYDAFELSDLVGPEGKVYAVDLGKNAIQSIQKKIDRSGRRNIEACASSASELGFIKDRSIDFVFANGLLCAMKYYRPLAVDEIKRILKLSGKAYLTGGGPPFGYLDQAEWENIMQGFNVERGGSYKENWAVVSLTQ
ncbi:MAG: class I SAM-dependent methyltransferase [Chloroflexi bacterium]|nr:class I SAM-dependent methyltransferase [Chloroflexota bacterium]